MRINWPNIFALMLLVFLIYMFVKAKPVLDQIFDGSNYVYYPGRPAAKIAITGLMCLTAVAIVKILSRR